VHIDSQIHLENLAAPQVSAAHKVGTNCLVIHIWCCVFACSKQRWSTEGSDNVRNTAGGRGGVLKGFGNNWIIIQPV